MVALLMLGIIPGTDIQIDFASWLLGVAFLAIGLGSYIAHRKRWLVHVMLLIAFYAATRRIKAFPSV